VDRLQPYERMKSIQEHSLPWLIVRSRH
jgi:hypothetical protein